MYSELKFVVVVAKHHSCYILPVITDCKKYNLQGLPKMLKFSHFSSWNHLRLNLWHKNWCAICFPSRDVWSLIFSVFSGLCLQSEWYWKQKTLLSRMFQIVSAWRCEPFCFCVCPEGICKACVIEAGWGGRGSGWHHEAGGQDCPLSLCVSVSGSARPLHALHHGRAVATTPTFQTSWGSHSDQPVFTALSPIHVSGRIFYHTYLDCNIVLLLPEDVCFSSQFDWFSVIKMVVLIIFFLTESMQIISAVFWHSMTLCITKECYHLKVNGRQCFWMCVYCGYQNIII